jgi:hypothetical protein
MKRLTIMGIVMLLAIASCQKSAVVPATGMKHPTSLTLSNGAFTFNLQQSIDLTGYEVLSGCGTDTLRITSGTYHIDVHETGNRNNVSSSQHANTQGLRLISLGTGTTYVGSASDDFVENGSFVGGKFIATQKETVIATTAGGKNNSTFSFDLHETFDASGNLTAFVDNLKLACR